MELGVNSLTDVEFLVIKGKGRPMIGRKTAMKLGVLKITIPEVNLVEDEFQDLFSENIGKLTNYEVGLQLGRMLSLWHNHADESLIAKEEKWKRNLRN